MAQPRRVSRPAVIPDEALGSAEDQKAIHDYIRSLKRRYRRYYAPIEEVRAAIDREMGDRTISEYILEARKSSF